VLIWPPPSLVIGLAYPAYVAHRAVAANDADLLRRTYHHFIVASAFFTAEAFLDILFFWCVPRAVAAPWLGILAWPHLRDRLYHPRLGGGGRRLPLYPLAKLAGVVALVFNNFQVRLLYAPGSKRLAGRSLIHPVPCG